MGSTINTQFSEQDNSVQGYSNYTDQIQSLQKEQDFQKLLLGAIHNLIYIESISKYFKNFNFEQLLDSILYDLDQGFTLMSNDNNGKLNIKNQNLNLEDQEKISNIFAYITNICDENQNIISSSLFYSNIDLILAQISKIQQSFLKNNSEDYGSFRVTAFPPTPTPAPATPPRTKFLTSIDPILPRPEEITSTTLSNFSESSGLSNSRKSSGDSKKSVSFSEPIASFINSENSESSFTDLSSSRSEGSSLSTELERILSSSFSLLTTIEQQKYDSVFQNFILDFQEIITHSEDFTQPSDLTGLNQFTDQIQQILNLKTSKLRHQKLIEFLSFYQISKQLKDLFPKNPYTEELLKNLSTYFQQDIQPQLASFYLLAEKVLNLHPELTIRQAEAYNLLVNSNKIINLEELSTLLKSNAVGNTDKIKYIQFFIANFHNDYLPICKETKYNVIRTTCNNDIVNLLNKARAIVMERRVSQRYTSPAYKALTLVLTDCEKLIKSLGGKIQNVTPSQASKHQYDNSKKANYQKTMTPILSENTQIIAKAVQQNAQERRDYNTYLASLSPEQLLVHWRDQAYADFMCSLLSQQREQYKQYQLQTKLHKDFIESKLNERQQVTLEPERIQSLKFNDYQLQLYRALMKAQDEVNKAIDEFLDPTVYQASSYVPKAPFVLPQRKLEKNLGKTYNAQQESVERLSEPEFSEPQISSLHTLSPQYLSRLHPSKYFQRLKA